MRTMPIQFSKFTLAGGVSTVLHYIVLVIIVDMMKGNPVYGSMIGYLFGGILNYYLNYKFTFESKKAHTSTASKFMVIMFVGFFLNGYLMTVFTSKIGLFYLVAQIFSTIVVLLWNFTANKFWTFSVVR